MIRVTVWNEFYHEKNDPRTAAVYPDGLHMAIKRMLECEDVTVRTATLDDPECGLTEEVLADTDVLVWWGHVRHHLVPDEVAKRVQMHVLSGMGLIVLHSGHKSKPFMRLMGTTCSLTWNEVGERERVFVIDPAHPKQELRETGRLCDLCPTMLDMMGLEQPKEMTGVSLIKH